MKNNILKFNCFNKVSLICNYSGLESGYFGSIYEKWFIKYFKNLEKDLSENGDFLFNKFSFELKTSCITSKTTENDFWRFRFTEKQKDLKADYYLFVGIDFHNPVNFEQVKCRFFLFTRNELIKSLSRCSIKKKPLVYTVHLNNIPDSKSSWKRFSNCIKIYEKTFEDIEAYFNFSKDKIQ